jgi:hypothetical protein
MLDTMSGWATTEETPTPGPNVIKLFFSGIYEFW